MTSEEKSDVSQSGRETGDVRQAGFCNDVRGTETGYSGDITGKEKGDG